MKKTALAVILIPTLLFSAVAGTRLNLILANPNPFTYPSAPDRSPPSIKIDTPEYNKTYGVSIVPYSITIDTSTFENNSVHTLRSIGYILDGREKVTISDNPSLTAQIMSFKGNLSRLPQGRHTIQAWVKSVSYYRPSGSQTTYEYSSDTYSDTSPFTIDIVPLRVSLIFLENKTYETTDIPLFFTVSDSEAHIKYSLDGKENITITGNTTLTGLSNGPHSVMVYAKDLVDTETFDSVWFNVAEPFPTIPVLIVIVAGVVVAGAGFLLYRKRGRGKTQ